MKPWFDIHETMRARRPGKLTSGPVDRVSIGRLGVELRAAIFRFWTLKFYGVPYECGMTPAAEIDETMQLDRARQGKSSPVDRLSIGRLWVELCGRDPFPSQAHGSQRAVSPRGLAYMASLAPGKTGAAR